MGKILAYSVNAEEYERLIAIERNHQALKRLLEKNNPKFVTVAMIANANEITRQDVLNRPWLMPKFGQYEHEEAGRRKRFWHFEEYVDWVTIPEHERIQDFKDLN